MKLSELDLKPQWDTDYDDVLNDFYIKVLTHAKRYDRQTFTFSSSLLAFAAKGLDGLIKGGGDMRLIVGDEIQEEDYNAIVDGDKLSRYKEQCLDKLKTILEGAMENRLHSHRAEILKYLIGSNRLEIKFALMKSGDGVSHGKVGIIHGLDHEKIVFEGSGNETLSGLDLNWEVFNAFFSWRKEIFQDYGRKYVENFERLWDYNQSQKIRTVTLPNNDLLEVFPKSGGNIPTVMIKPKSRESALANEDFEILIPKIPEYIGDNKFEPRPYQKKALEDWSHNKFKGILEHATGSGKTLTAIYGITKTFLASKGPIIAIVGVPYTILAEQWAEEFKLFNIVPILCFGDSARWQMNVKNRISAATTSGKPQLIVIIAVNASLMGERFREVNEIIKNSNIQSIFIGDECHEYAGRDITKLPDSEYRLGLSATPFTERDDAKAIAKNNNLKSYFGDVVNQFTLEDALKKDYLCPYEYHPIFIRLTEEEEKDYMDLSQKIAAAFTSDSNEKSDDTAMNILLGKRARLIGSAEEKFIKLKSLAKDLNKPTNTLVFCGDGKTEDIADEEKKDKQKVREILKGLSWEAAEFTAEVDADTRKSRIEDFKDNTINALIAIKVLDQGVNIPAIEKAIIIASARSKRQYIQRLGRVLRKSKNKDLAHIYDFIVLPWSKSNLSEALQRLIEEEKKRFDEFSNCCKNKALIKNTFEESIYS